MDKERIIQYMKQLGISLDEAQAQAFVRYYELLVEWNSFMNLTAITDPEEVLVKHFADSLAPGFDRAAGGLPEDTAAPGSGAKQPVRFTANTEASLLDVGTGAGFPAIPLKIAFPQLKITMLDSLGKRVKFLNEVITQLKLSDIRAIHGRAEDLAHDPEHREAYDYVVSRAVANMSVLSEYCLPYVKCGGFLIAYKSREYLEGNEAESSANAVKLLGGKNEGLRRIRLPENDAERCLVYIYKEKNTAKKYPRKAGLPSKEPL